MEHEDKDGINKQTNTQRFWRPGTKPDVCENGFPRFKTHISCLQF